MNGFEIGFAKATLIASVSADVESSYFKQRTRTPSWPGYVYGKKFFELVGAEFRIVEKKQEMLLADIVYEIENYEPCGIYKKRSIGSRAIDEFRRLGIVQPYDDEDLWEKPTIYLITALGMCLARCQQIERYLSRSFIFGIFSETQKKKYLTIDDMRKGWSRMTLGQMLRSIEEAWMIHPVVKPNLDLFLEHRNLLIHGITTSERFDIDTVWGQRELLAFLDFFDVHSRMVKKAFKASLLASIDFGIKQFGLPKGSPKRIFKKKEKEELELFFAYFYPKLMEKDPDWISPTSLD
jgi:hypothetical protein